MPTVPSYGSDNYTGPRVETARLKPEFTQPRDTSKLFGAPEAKAQQGLGKMVAAIGDRLGEVTQELQIQENEFQVKKADVALSEGYRNILYGDGTPENPGYLSTNAESATSALQATKERLADLRKTITESIPGTRPKEMFSLVAESREQQAFGVAAMHSLEQGEIAKNAISLARAKSAENDAAMPLADLPKLAGIAAGENVAVARKKSQDPEYLRIAAVEGATAVYKTGIASAIGRRDVVEAQRLLGLYGAKMDGKAAADAAESIVVAKEEERRRTDAALAKAKEGRTLARINEYVDLSIAASQGQDVTQQALAFRQKYADDAAAALNFKSIMLAGGPERERLAKEQALIDRGFAAISQQLVLDPWNAEDNKAANATFSALTQSWGQQGLTPAQVLEKSAVFAEQTGVVPEEMKNAIRGGLNSLNPETVIGAASILTRVTSRNPVLANQFSNEQISMGMDIADYISSGADAKQAVSLARATRRVPEAEKKQLDMDFTAAAKENPPATYLSKKYATPFYLADPAASSVMLSEFERLARAEFVKTGKLDASYAAAGLMVDKVWGVSSVGASPRLVKHPPEKLYGVANLTQDQNAEWMLEQLRRDFTSNAMYPPGAENTVTVTPHPYARTEDGRVKYSVMFQNPATGELETVMDSKGSPLAWQPDYSSSPAYARGREVQRQNEQAAIKSALERRLLQTPGGKDRVQQIINDAMIAPLGGP